MQDHNILSAESAPLPAAAATALELPSKPYLTLALATHLLQAAQVEAMSKGWLQSIAIVDDGGHVWAVHRLDGAPPSTAAIATEKARTAALIRRPNKAFEDLINGGRPALLSIGCLDSLLDGGTPLMVRDHCIGAIGVSGGRPPEDNAVVDATLRALPA